MVFFTRELNRPFIEGETVNLYPIDVNLKSLRIWTMWFNDSKITRNLDQGVFPNTLYQQFLYSRSLVRNSSRIALFMYPKGQPNDSHPVGIVSLSAINLAMGQCDFALIRAGRENDKLDPFLAYEAKALMVQHAFDNLGITRINSEQSVDLYAWQKNQILLGFQIEGISRSKFRKGKINRDVFVSSCVQEDYEELIRKRNGKLWPGRKLFERLCSEVREPTLISQLSDFLKQNQKKSFQEMLDMESRLGTN